MRTLLAVISFAVIWATVAALDNYVSVYTLGMTDPKFGSADSNYDVVMEVLPWFLAVAVTSFLAGVWPHRLWYGRAPVLIVVAAAAACGLVCSLALFAFTFVDWLLTLPGELFPITWFLWFGMPAICGRKFFGAMRGRLGLA